jgi:dihydrofolate reductase
MGKTSALPTVEERIKEVHMRRIVAGLFMSLDGVVESPGAWGGFNYMNDVLAKRIANGIAEADAVLLGRRTYVEFAQLWPSQSSDVPMADFLNNSRKYVVSATLNAPLKWANSNLITGDVAQELTKLKQQPGKNIQVPGSPTLLRSLLRDGLLDELSLTICPVVVGSGMHLFDGLIDHVALNLVDSTTLSNGAVDLTYQPAQTDRNGSPASFPDAASRN